MDIGLKIKWQREVGGLVDFNLVLGLNLNRNFIILQKQIVGQKSIWVIYPQSMNNLCSKLMDLCVWLTRFCDLT